ncbi:MAG: hypothetical protein RLZZ399_2784 [Verrucomicrobiota bacterium]
MIAAVKTEGKRVFLTNKPSPEGCLCWYRGDRWSPQGRRSGSSRRTHTVYALKNQGIPKGCHLRGAIEWASPGFSGFS